MVPPLGAIYLDETRELSGRPVCDREPESVWIGGGTPTQVPVGQPYEYELRVTNLSSHPLEEVVVVERNG